eukprot:473789-Rhodomonas_salina.1
MVQSGLDEARRGIHSDLKIGAEPRNGKETGARGPKPSKTSTPAAQDGETKAALVPKVGVTTTEKREVNDEQISNSLQQLVSASSAGRIKLVSNPSVGRYAVCTSRTHVAVTHKFRDGTDIASQVWRQMPGLIPGEQRVRS